MTSVAVESRRKDAYRRDIDGLRAIAILSVVLFHAGVRAFSGGFVGVDVFFVISGYLIGAHVYADVRRERFRIRDFYRKRAKRILPALLVVIALCELFAVLVLSPVELTMFARYCIATLASAANILAWAKSGYFAAGADQNPLLMAWSLGVEEQFYIFFPLLMIALRRVRRRDLLVLFAGIAGVSLLDCWWTTTRSASAAFYLLPTRAWELAIGVLLAIYEDRRDPLALYGQQKLADVVSLLGVGLILFAVFRFDANTAFPGVAAVLPVLGSAMLLSSPASYFNRLVLSSAPFVFIGQVSYSLYLWHWPLLSFAHVISDEPISVAMGCSIAAVSLAIACVSYWVVEQPFRRSETPSIPLLLRYAVLSFLLAVPAAAFRLTLGLPQRFVPMGKLEVAHDMIARECVGEAGPVESKACIDRSDTRPGVALIGDSHAAAMAPAIADAAARQGYKVYRMFRYSCPPLVGVARTLGSTDQERGCLEFNRRTMDLLTSDPSVRVVVLTGYWAGPAIDRAAYVTSREVGSVPGEHMSEDNLERGLRDTIAMLRGSGKKVVLLQDVPVFVFDPVRRMISDYIPVRSYIGRHLFSPGLDKAAAPMTETFVEEEQKAAAILRSAAARGSVELFDPAANLCRAGECRFLDGGDPLYGDKQHVTPRGAAVAVAGLRLP